MALSTLNPPLPALEDLIALNNGMNPWLVFMQDGASPHSAKDTQAYLNEHGIYPIFWPAFHLI